MMEKCFEYLGCSQTGCIMYGRGDDLNCWEVEGTLCNHPGMALIAKSKKDKCAYCLFYKMVHGDASAADASEEVAPDPESKQPKVHQP